MVGGIIALGRGRLVSLSHSAHDTWKLQHVYFEMFCHTGSRLLLDVHDNTDESTRLQQWNLCAHVCSEQCVLVFSSQREVFFPELVWAHHSK